MRVWLWRSALVLLFGLIQANALPAHAYWYPCYDSSKNYGADYVGAAIDCFYWAYPTGVVDGADSFGYNTHGEPSLYSVRGHLGGIQNLHGYAGNTCPLGQKATLDGCTGGPPAPQGSPACIDPPFCRNAAGNPINLISGNKYEDASDFKTEGENSLQFRRYYNSDVNYLAVQPALLSRLGYGWRTDFDSAMVADNVPASATSVDYVRADGRAVHFAKSGSSWYVAYWDPAANNWSATPAHSTDIRLSTDGTSWFVTDAADTVETYNSVYSSGSSNYVGKLQSIKYRNGYQINLTYDGAGNNTGIGDTLGRQLTLTYLANGLLDTLTDQDGNVTHYSYLEVSGTSPPPPAGSAGLWVLQQVTFPDTTTVTYLYEDARAINRFALTGIIDGNNKRFATWAYDDLGRATSSQHAGGADLTTISYDDVGNTRTVTNALTKQAVYQLASFENSLRIGSIQWLASPNSSGFTQSLGYDSNGFVQTYTSGAGRQIFYVHNSIGQETSRTEGYGTSDARTVTTSWNPTYRVPDEIDEPNLKINFYYVGALLDHLTETDQTTQSVPYSTNGQTRTWQFGYWPSGLLHTVDGPLAGTGDTVTYAYNASGFVSSVTDELGHITQITAWNGRGQPLTSIDSNSITTTYTYDTLGRIKTITVNPGTSQALTSIGYDNAGNVHTLTAPDGLILTYNYDDAHRLSSVVNNLGETITYTRDALGDVTMQTIKSASSVIVKSQTATFDELARVLKNIGAASQTTQHAYDNDDNEIQTTDPRNKIYGHAFDALNRLYQETDPSLKTTTVQYNGKDEIVSVADARSLTTSYVRDGFGDAIQQTSPDTGTTIYYYDALGDVTEKLDSRGVETDYTYDAKGRIKTRKIHGTTAENVTFTYDNAATNGIDRLRKIADPSGSTTFNYGPLGYVTKEIRVVQANTYNVTFVNDPAGHPLTITYPSGRIVTYTRDSMGRISGITTKQNSGAPVVTVASSVGYQPFGPLAGFNFGNGLVLSLAYDQDYQLSGIVAANGATTIQNLTYGYDPAGNINPITDNLNAARTQSFTYGNTNRVKMAAGAYGSQSYGYDAVGNRLNRTIGSVTDTYAISPTSNRVNTVTTGSNVRSFSYLPTGQVSNDTRDPSHAYVYNYNQTGRFTSATLNGSTVGTSLINGLEQRVAKTAGSATTHFIFDRLGHLLAEADGATGATQKEYIWLDDLPVAMVDDTGASPVITYIHTDHLGTPQKITDSAMNLVWDGVFDPFGNASSITGSVTMNLRFPGQYFDAETGLAQNWNRDYDPTLGRYIESDPIGLLGGVNTYAYVYAEPNLLIDPLGLYGWRDLLLDTSDLTGGFWDTVTFGLTDLVRGQLGMDAAVNKCRGIYRAGEYSGVAFDIVVGAGAGLEAAGARGLGKEFSHWIPARLGGGRSLLNGNYMSVTEHALADPYRYQFMSRAWKEANPLPSPLAQQWNRIPNLYKGTAIGVAAGAVGASNIDCECQK